MLAQDTLQTYASEQGWNEKSQIKLLCDFIDTYLDVGNLAKYLRKRKNYENAYLYQVSNELECIMEEALNRQLKSTLGDTLDFLNSISDDELISITENEEVSVNFLRRELAEELENHIEVHGTEFLWQLRYKR